MLTKYLFFILSKYNQINNLKMKQFIFLFLVVIFVSSISSCSGDDDNPTETENEYYIKATVNGQLETAMTATLSSKSNETLVLLSYFSDNQTEFISIKIDNYTGSGTYLIGENSNNPNSSFNLVKMPDIFYLSGYYENFNTYIGNITVNIQETGNLLTGTFSGTTIDEMNIANSNQIQVTNGEFKVLKMF